MLRFRLLAKGLKIQSSAVPFVPEPEPEPEPETENSTDYLIENELKGESLHHTSQV